MEYIIIGIIIVAVIFFLIGRQRNNKQTAHGGNLEGNNFNNEETKDTIDNGK